MLKFAAARLQTLRGMLDDMAAGRKSDLMMRRAGAYSIEGEIGSLIQPDPAIGEARVQFHRALDAFAGERNLTRLAMRSQEENDQLRDKAVAALRLLAAALEIAKPSLRAREEEDVSEVDAPEL